MVAATCGLPKVLSDSQSAVATCILTINNQASLFAFLIPLENMLRDAMVGTHLNVCQRTSNFPLRRTWKGFSCWGENGHF